MEMKNLAGKWHYMEINPATGKPYESEHMDNGVSVQKRPNDLPYKCDRCADMYEHEIEDLQNRNIALLDECEELAKKLDNANDDIQYLRKVCKTQADSFAAIENENTVLRSKLNRIRELAERLENA